MKPTTEKRKGTLRRQVNDLVMRDGEVQESKLWANLFKAAALWLVMFHAETVLKDWAILATLLVIGVAPDLLKKMITMKLGGHNESSKP